MNNENDQDYILVTESERMWKVEGCKLIILLWVLIISFYFILRAWY